MPKWLKELLRKKNKFSGHVIDGGLNENGEYLVILKVTDGNLYELAKWKNLQTKIVITETSSKQPVSNEQN